MGRSFLFLGTGSSMGIPVVGCDCPVCLSEDSKNKRLRTSGVLRWDNKTILIDVGPDFRSQALLYDLQQIDGFLLTHSHYDHIGGLDELRAYNFSTHSSIPCLVSNATYEDLKTRMPYLFQSLRLGNSFPAQFDFCVVNPPQKLVFQGLDLTLFLFYQGDLPVMGFRIGDFAYLSDIKDYPTDLLDSLQGVKSLVVSALKPKSSPIHFSVDEAVEFAMRVGAKKSYLVHMAHEIDHTSIAKSLPSQVTLAYDGLEIKID